MYAHSFYPILRSKKFERKAFLAEPKIPAPYFKVSDDPNYLNSQVYVPSEVLASVSQTFIKDYLN